MKKVIFAVMVIILGANIFGIAEEPVPQPQDLETLRKAWEESRGQYRDALTAKRISIQSEMQKKETLIENETVIQTRKLHLGHLRRLQAERDDVNSKIREINASDVVKFSTGRDKLVAVLTGQAST